MHRDDCGTLSTNSGSRLVIRSNSPATRLERRVPELADEAVSHLVDGGRAAPVVGIGDEDDVLAAVAASNL